jgi:riboflavin kinase / FMN adenylyltransferase
MKLFRDPVGPPITTQSVIAIGAFDGLHLGHQALISRAAAHAKQLGWQAGLISFEPLPREFFGRPGMLRLTPCAQKLNLLSESDLDWCLLARFNHRLSAMSAEDFVREVIVTRAQAIDVWVGTDFRFGRGRVGDLALLKTLGAQLGFGVQTISDVQFSGERISSSAIREALLAADFVRAKQMLGRSFSFAHRVVRGKQLGRTLGFPTANLRWPKSSVAMSGIYAVRVNGAGLNQHPAVASLGTRPTVGGIEPLLEVHLFDFDGDLYGQRLEVEFVAKQREEWKFPSLESMIEQIHRDAEQARERLKN